MPTTRVTTSAGCCCPPGDCSECGDPSNFAETTLVSDCPTYDGLVVPITWDAGSQCATGTLQLGDVCDGCNAVTVSICCVAGVWTQTVGIVAGPPGESCSQTPPGGGCTASSTTVRCDSCITITSRNCFGDVGNCCTGTFHIDAVTTTC